MLCCNSRAKREFEKLCFSLKTKDRTLDLEAKDELTRDQFYEAFNWLLEANVCVVMTTNAALDTGTDTSCLPSKHFCYKCELLIYLGSEF